MSHPRSATRRATEVLHCRLAAARIEPGDRLPPQPALHGTPWQTSGFTVGSDARDVLVDSPVLSGRVLLFGATGVLDSIRRTAVVEVERLASRAAGGDSPEDAGHTP